MKLKVIEWNLHPPKMGFFFSDLSSCWCKDANFCFGDRCESDCFLKPLRAHIHFVEISARTNHFLNSLRKKIHPKYKQTRLSSRSVVCEVTAREIPGIPKISRYCMASHRSAIWNSVWSPSYTNWWVIMTSWFITIPLDIPILWVVWESSRTPWRSFRFPNR